MDPLLAELDLAPTNGSVMFNPDGSFEYTPNADFFGDDTFTYRATDDGGTSFSTPATVTITVTNVNDDPVVTDDAYTVTEDTTLTVDAASGVVANDFDADGDALSVTLVTDTTDGALTLNSDGSFEFVPNADFFGDTTFTYTVNDGTVESAVATVTITVDAVDDPPVANDQMLVTPEDTAVSTTLTASDVDTPVLDLTYAIDTPPTNGLITSFNGIAGTVTYQPNANFTGFDTFTFVANDGTSDSAPATVQIEVAGDNDGPTAGDDGYILAEDTTLTIEALNGILSNDTDPDGDTLTAVLVTDVASGTLSLQTDGGFVYTPNADFFGTDVFTYAANDGALSSNVASVTLTVANVNDAPDGRRPGGLGRRGHLRPDHLGRQRRGQRPADLRDRARSCQRDAL